ncbi:MAG: tail fiber domain-containing protein, partial [Alphaproteobacteria bacterium]|nr:tail fiber domain-containing protein [Alphaproteobacteria bacterium]
SGASPFMDFYSGATKKLSLGYGGGSPSYFPDGNVGIGTTNPANTLQIGSVGSSGYGGNRFVVGDGTHVIAIQPYVGNSATFYTNTNFAFMPSGGTGYVGIGTTSPSYPLDIEANPSGVALKAAGAISSGIQVITPNLSSPSSGINLAFALGGTIYMTLASGGYVGIGTTSPSYPLHVNGTAYATGAAGALSDVRHKDKIKTLSFSGLDVVSKLRPVSFVWKEPKDSGMKGEQIGFIAQEVESVLPQVVLTENNAEKTKSLKYSEIIPVLTKAIQEMKAANDDLRRVVETQDKEIRMLKARVR